LEGLLVEEALHTATKSVTKLITKQEQDYAKETNEELNKRKDHVTEQLMKLMSKKLHPDIFVRISMF